jgi:hypothetical protein
MEEYIEVWVSWRWGRSLQRVGRLSSMMPMSNGGILRIMKEV